MISGVRSSERGRKRSCGGSARRSYELLKVAVYYLLYSLFYLLLLLIYCIIYTII